MQGQLIDGFGRSAKKLRISITDRCNMQCIYCMPKGNDHWLASDEILSDAEIIRLAKIFARLGVVKIRITGGEPMLRPGIENLVKGLALIGGIRSISITTNGILFADKIIPMKRAGLQSVNISLDTLKREKFKAMTGVDGLGKVLSCINETHEAGLDVKINAVIIRGWNDDEIVDFTRFGIQTDNLVRFIEFMPLDGSGMWAPDLVFGKREMMEKIEAALGKLLPLGNPNSEPARLYSVSGNGTVGFIPSMTEPFCAACDRVRITSEGRFLACLFENPGHDVKTLLRGGKSEDEIAGFIIQCMKKKPEGVAGLIRMKSLRPKMNLMHTIGG